MAGAISTASGRLGAARRAEKFLPRGLGNPGIEEHHVEILTRQ
jgi:hypothetical protein